LNENVNLEDAATGALENHEAEDALAHNVGLLPAPPKFVFVPLLVTSRVETSQTHQFRHFHLGVGKNFFQQGWVFKQPNESGFEVICSSTLMDFEKVALAACSIRVHEVHIG